MNKISSINDISNPYYKGINNTTADKLSPEQHDKFQISGELSQFPTFEPVTNTNCKIKDFYNSRDYNKLILNIGIMPLPSPVSPVISGIIQKDFFDGRVGKRLINLNVIHINDLHGIYSPQKDLVNKPDGTPIGGLAYISTKINEYRSKNSDGTIVLDAGDIFDGTFVSYKSGGDIISLPYNKIGFDAITIGNHDFIWGLDKLAAFAAKTGAPFLSANMLDVSNNAALKDVKPYIEKEIKGIKVGILGITTPSAEYSDTGGNVMFRGAFETVKRYLPELKKRNNIVIVLSHLGIEEDRKLASEFQDIDIIVGGHSHHLLPKGERVGSTLIAQAGSRGKFIGNISLGIDPDTKKVINTNVVTEMVDTSKIKPDNDISDIISKIEKVYEKEAFEKIGFANEPLEFNEKASVKFANFVMGTSSGEAKFAWKDSAGNILRTLSNLRSSNGVFLLIIRSAFKPDKG